MKPIHLIKDDWDVARQRLAHWWANELYDRALVCVTAPKSSVQRGEWRGAPKTVERYWTNGDHMIWRTLEAVRRTYYGGEAVPSLWHGWSVGHALPLGCEPRFAEDTVWTDPLPVEADGFPPIRFQRDGRWWKWMQETTLAVAQASQGRYCVMPAWGNHAGDNLALVRGTEKLMIDVAENPAWVRQAVRKVSDILLEFLAALWPLVDEKVTGVEGSMNGCGLWSPGRNLALDCDISCMVSTAQFEDLFLPPLIETARTVDYCVYHLDGTVALQHLDLLLSLPEIRAIQWVPGAGHEAILQWVPLIRRIQKAGKSVLVYAKPAEIPALLGEVSARGLCIGTGCTSEPEARELLDVVSRRSRS